MSWKSALVSYVRNPNHEHVVYKNSSFLIVKDCYPKAEIHFLILSRSTGINSISELTGKDCQMVENMLRLAQEEIIDKNKGRKFQVGFHSVPSMDQLHLHVISTDFCSPALKNKKHYLSITNDEFFVTANQVVESLKQDGKIDVRCQTSIATLSNFPDPIMNGID